MRPVWAVLGTLDELYPIPGQAGLRLFTRIPLGGLHQMGARHHRTVEFMLPRVACPLAKLQCAATWAMHEIYFEGLLQFA